MWRKTFSCGKVSNFSCFTINFVHPSIGENMKQNIYYWKQECCQDHFTGYLRCIDNCFPTLIIHNELYSATSYKHTCTRFVPKVSGLTMKHIAILGSFVFICQHKTPFDLNTFKPTFIEQHQPTQNHCCHLTLKNPPRNQWIFVWRFLGEVKKEFRGGYIRGIRRVCSDLELTFLSSTRRSLH